jgi:hypothetical protein
MRVAGRRGLSLWEWVAIFGIVVAAIGGTKAANVSRIWQSVAIYTAIIFTCLCVALRPAWGRTNFWLAMAACFIVHSVAMFFAVREFPAIVARDFHGVPQFAFGIVESLVIASFLWRASKKTSPQDAGGPPFMEAGGPGFWS